MIKINKQNKRVYNQLLSIGADSKTIKGETENIMTGILYLSPYKKSGKNFCSFATAGCIAGCLDTAGRGKFNTIQEARLKKSLYFINNKTNFLLDLVESIIRLKKKAYNKKFTPVVRLNGTSDLLWENINIKKEDLFTRKYIVDNMGYLSLHKILSSKEYKKFNMMTLFTDLTFYDYTKNPFRTTPKNYYLTFSRAENNDNNVQIAIERGLNIAVVFDKLPKKYLGRNVINGDKTDLRFTDPKNIIVGLIPKGDAKKDTSGFVVR